MPLWGRAQRDTAMNLGDERSRRHLGRDPQHLGRLRRVGKDGQIAQHDHVGVEPGSTQRPQEAFGLEDLIAAAGQRVTVALSALAVVRDQEDAGYAVEWIHVLTSCVSVPAEG